MEMIVLCGGFGTRLGPLTQNAPKPLLPLGGSPFLLRLLSQWKHEGVQRFILSAHFCADQIHQFSKTYAQDFDLSVIVEDKPLGTGGAIRYATTQVQSDTLLVSNGDSYTNQPVPPVIEAHKKRGVEFTMVAVKAEKVLGGAEKKGQIDIGSQGELLGFSTQESATGWINAGLYVFNRQTILSWPTGPCSFEKELLTSSRRPKTYVFPSQGSLLDIGTPECYHTYDQQLGPIENLFSKLEQ
jgi:D-glycero-alpha-D-manno-heptose 1-phosphate guanylyltransferase